MTPPVINCSSCRFFRKNEEKYAARHSCCRTSPVPIAVIGSRFANGQLNAPMISTSVETHWPQIRATDWCGEFQAAEAKGGLS